MSMLCSLLFACNSSSDNFSKEDNDPYNGFPAPVELSCIASNEKNSLHNSTDYRVDIEGLWIIEDSDGVKFLVATYSVTNLLSDRRISWPISSGKPDLFQNGDMLNSAGFSDLSDECVEAYDEILRKDYISELSPNEKGYSCSIFEIYDTSSEITLLINYNMAYVINSNGEYVLYDERALETDIIRKYSFN